MPLFVRKSSNTRGGYSNEHLMRPGGIVHCDNSPAQWVMRMCLDECYDRANPINYQDLQQKVTSQQFPLNMVMDAEGIKDDACLFKKGLREWEGVSRELKYHTAHIVDVGLADKKLIPDFQIADLKLHFIRLMSPLNMLLVPMELKGLADLTSFKQTAFRANSDEYGPQQMNDFKFGALAPGFISKQGPEDPDV